MKASYLSLLAGTLVLLQAACTTPQGGLKPDIAINNGFTVVNNAANQQSSYIKTRKTFLRFCTETDVDVSKTRASGYAFGIGVDGSNDTVGEKSGQGALSLGGRDPAVLITRELMFRACEFIMNVNADPRLALKVYAGTLDAVIKIARSQQLRGTASVTEQQNVDLSQIEKTTETALTKNTDNTGNTSQASKKPSAPASKKQASNDDSFDWSYDWDYSDSDNSIDQSHP